MTRRREYAIAIMGFALTALSMCGLSAAAQAQTVKRDPAQLSELFAKFFNAKQALVFSTSKQTCTADPCVVTITLDTTTYNDKVYCIASLPETLEFAAPSGKSKGILWKLSTGSLAGRVVEFHETAGILLVNPGNNAQFKPNNKRTSATEFEAKNMHSKKDTATYVPVILFLTADGIPELCAAGDPKIVNP
jgi:hypothetical protein